MKKYLYTLLLVPQLLYGQTADEILASVRARLPQIPLTLTGRFRHAAMNGYTRTRLPMRAHIHLGRDPAHARYEIGAQQLEITWTASRTDFLFSPTGPHAEESIAGSAMRWNELSFSFLWWPDARLIGTTKKSTAMLGSSNSPYRIVLSGCIYG